MRHTSLQLRPVRLRHQSNFESVIAIGSRIAQMVIALIAVIIALDYGEVILAPIFLGICIGLMFSPLAGRIEKFGAGAVSRPPSHQFRQFEVCPLSLCLKDREADVGRPRLIHLQTTVGPRWVACQ